MGICQPKSRVTFVDEPQTVGERDGAFKENSEDNGSITSQEIPENKLYPQLPNIPLTNSLVHPTMNKEKTFGEVNQFDEENEAGRINVKPSEALDEEQSARLNTLIFGDTPTELRDGSDDLKDPNIRQEKEPETQSIQTNEQKNDFANDEEGYMNEDGYALTKSQENSLSQKMNKIVSYVDSDTMDDSSDNDTLKSMHGKSRSIYNPFIKETPDQSYSEQSSEKLLTGMIIQTDQKKGGYTKKSKKKKSRRVHEIFDEKKKADFEYYEKEPKQKRIEKFEKRVQELERENEELRMRLSRAAGAALCLNNPDIADLSDVNRPTRIQERYSELYDNEWTDAFDNLRTLYSSEETIGLLLKLLVVIFKVCQRIATEQLDSLKVFGEEESIPKETMKLLKDNRKKNYKKYLNSLNPHIKEKIEQEFTVEEDKKRILPYLKTCRELCWLMVIQDPPMVLDTHIDRKGESFDKGIFKEYTESGQRISYVVWPPLFLHENGPLMMKGVAQGDNTP